MRLVLRPFIHSLLAVCAVLCSVYQLALHACHQTTTSVASTHYVLAHALPQLCDVRPLPGLDPWHNTWRGWQLCRQHDCAPHTHAWELHPDARSHIRVLLRAGRSTESVVRTSHYQYRLHPQQQQQLQQRYGSGNQLYCNFDLGCTVFLDTQVWAWLCC